MRQSLCLLVYLLAGSVGADSSMGCPGTPFKTPGDLVKKNGEYELHIWIMAKGTRSEGRHGGLLRKGQWVDGIAAQVMDTPVGSLRYGGDFAKRKWAWSDSGWLPLADKDSR